MSTTNSVPLSPFQLTYAGPEQWRKIVQQALADARVSTPAILTADVDVNTQTVTVQIAIQEFAALTIGAKPDWVTVKPIINVPVVLPRGGGFSLTLPLKKGDEGMLVFCDTCFDWWWQHGGVQPQFERRRHHIHDCGFIPGMWSQPNVLSNYSSNSLQLRSDDGNTVIDLASGTITITSGTSVVLNTPTIDAGNGGTVKALMNDTFYQWYVTNIQPFLVSKGYAGPGVPAGSETTVLKGQ